MNLFYTYYDFLIKFCDSESGLFLEMVFGGLGSQRLNDHPHLCVVFASFIYFYHDFLPFSLPYLRQRYHYPNRSCSTPLSTSLVPTPCCSLCRIGL
jgi:hypothetical protein